MFSKELLDKIWEKGTDVNNIEPNYFKKDCCNAIISKEHYNDINSPYGWGVDYIVPLMLGGDDDLINMRPMHIENIKSKSDDYPSYIAVITSDDNSYENHSCNQQFKINKKLQDELNEKYNLKL